MAEWWQIAREPGAIDALFRKQDRPMDDRPIFTPHEIATMVHEYMTPMERFANWLTRGALFEDRFERDMTERCVVILEDEIDHITRERAGDYRALYALMHERDQLRAALAEARKTGDAAMPRFVINPDEAMKLPEVARLRAENETLRAQNNILRGACESYRKAAKLADQIERDARVQGMREAAEIAEYWAANLNREHPENRVALVYMGRTVSAITTTADAMEKEPDND